MNLAWKKLDSFSDLGLLVMRLGVGALFLFVHGFPKLAGGPDEWASVGRAVSYLGINFGYAGWGFAAALAETLGGFFLIIGFAHRPASLALFVTMVVAAIWKYYPFGGWEAAAHPAVLAAVFLGLLFTGPGKYSLDANS